MTQLIDSNLPTPLFIKEDKYAATVKLVQRFKDVKGIIVNIFVETESYARFELFFGR